MIAEFDKDNDGEISQSEFLNIILGTGVESGSGGFDNESEATAS